MSREMCILCGCFRDIALYERCEKDASLWNVQLVFGGYHSWIDWEPKNKLFGKSMVDGYEDFRGAMETESEEWL